MPHLGFHPAPGLGDLMPGSYVVPNNPFHPASLNPSPVGRVPSIGELLPAKFPIPFNPIVHHRGVGGVSTRGFSYGSRLYDWYLPYKGAVMALSPYTTPSHFPAGWDLPPTRRAVTLGSHHGMGFLPVGGTGSILVLGGAVILLLLLLRPGGSEYRQEMDKAKMEYRAKVRSIKQKHRGYRRAGRAVARGIDTAAKAVKQ